MELQVKKIYTTALLVNRFKGLLGKAYVYLNERNETIPSEQIIAKAWKVCKQIEQFNPASKVTFLDYKFQRVRVCFENNNLLTIEQKKALDGSVYEVCDD
ncbi:MAG: hypothetical protein ACI88H_000473 [Cocleimonas sp.]